MSVTFNNHSINEAFLSKSLANLTLNGIEMLEQTIFFKQGSASNGDVITGDISLFGGSNPLITAEMPAKGKIAQNASTYGFGLDYSGDSAEYLYKLCDDGYEYNNDVALNHRAMVQDASMPRMIRIYIYTPFTRYKLLKIGYVQSDHVMYANRFKIFKGSTVLINNIDLESGDDRLNPGYCTLINVNEEFENNLTFGISSRTETKPHAMGDIVFVLAISRKEYLKWRYGEYSPPVHLSNGVSIIRD